MPHIVFVYGTLKRGFPNHGLMAGADFLGEAITRHAYPMVVHGQSFSPVLMPEPGHGHRVKGELWQVDDERLAALDELESIGQPTGYIRERIEIEISSSRQLTTAWVYFKPRDRVKVIHGEPHADYQDRRYVPGPARRG